MIVDYPQFGTLETETAALRKSRVQAIAQGLRELAEQREECPFDPFAFASKIGIKVNLAELPPGCSGRLRTDTGYALIELSGAEQRTRQRFTLCHELAHICFWSGDPILRNRGVPVEGEKRVEKEELLCDQIASELLMPHNVFVRRAKLLPPSFDSVGILAAEFDVSVLATLGKLRSTTDHKWCIASVIWGVLGANTLRQVKVDLRGAPVGKKLQPLATATITDTIRRAELVLNRDRFVLSNLASGYVTLAMKEPQVTIWRRRMVSRGHQQLNGAIFLPSNIPVNSNFPTTEWAL